MKRAFILGITFFLFTTTAIATSLQESIDNATGVIEAMMVTLWTMKDAEVYFDSNPPALAALEEAKSEEEVAAAVKKLKDNIAELNGYAHDIITASKGLREQLSELKKQDQNNKDVIELTEEMTKLVKGTAGIIMKFFDVVDPALEGLKKRQAADDELQDLVKKLRADVEENNSCAKLL